MEDPAHKKICVVDQIKTQAKFVVDLKDQQEGTSEFAISEASSSDVSAIKLNNFMKKNNLQEVPSGPKEIVLTTGADAGRHDAFGNKIRRGSKMHKVAFADKIAKRPLTEVVNIESIKKKGAGSCCNVYSSNKCVCTVF